MQARGANYEILTDLILVFNNGEQPTTPVDRIRIQFEILTKERLSNNTNRKEMLYQDHYIRISVRINQCN